MAEESSVWFRSVLYQGHEGLMLECYAHPKVEDYFKTLGEAYDLSKQMSGSKIKWFSPDRKPILVYPFSDGGGRGDDYSDGYSLNPVGYDFTSFHDDYGYPADTFNLSFLRLVGISGANGVRIGIKQPSSHRGRKNIRSSMEKAVRKFIRNTISTSRLELVIRAREIQ